MAQSNPTITGVSSSPISDVDPYSEGPSRTIQSSTTLPPHIDERKLARPFFLGPLFGYTTAYRTLFINSRFIAFQAAIGRPLTVTEEKAVAWHTSKSVAIMSWGPGIGVSAGLGRSWATRREMQVLGLGKLNDEGVNEKWKAYAEAGGPKPPSTGLRWDSGRLYVGDRELFKALNPVRKMAVVQGLRALSYISLTTIFTTILLRITATTAMVVGESTDPQLNDVAKRLQERSKKKSLEQQRGTPLPAGKNRVDSTDSRSRRRQVETQQNQQITSQRGVVNDDASPTSGEDFYTDIGTERATETTMSDKVDPQARGGFPKTSQENPFDIPEKRGGFQQERYENQVPNSESSFDELSPTGGAGAVGNDDSNAGGSVWDRIRQSSMSGSSPRKGDGYEQERSGDDGFAYSSTEEEKAYARMEAQKEFDARVEKEREGRDFDAGRKW